MKYQNIREEELKNKIASDYFWLHDCTKIIGNVDFCVAIHQNQNNLFEQESLLWAEAKRGSSDIYKSIVQLVLTIGKARTFDKYLPPTMLGAFDGEKIAFVPYSNIHDIFYINDFNWNVTPSNHDTKEFKLIEDKVKTTIEKETLLFNFLNDDTELKKFIKNNFIEGKYGLTKTKIDKNNFMVVYNKWLKTVKPTIAVNWEIAKKTGIIDGDFYLADLLTNENNTLKDKLFVLLRQDHYELDRKLDDSGFFNSKRTDFIDNQIAHTQFWNKYERPPKEEYWDYIVERRDLLVPQDVRERKGSFFTPQIWVELSQKYLTDVLGEDWQEEYYIWDCAAGTGNLLANLTNKYNIWASTLDQQDVAVMHERIDTMNKNSAKGDGSNLLKDHVFQFDFLNDDFSKLPKILQEIINNEEKRKKLIIYINPPYAEATSAKTAKGTGENKTGVTTNFKIKELLNAKIGNATNEIFALFMAVIYEKMQGCILGQFSTLKFVNGSNFKKFKEFFLTSYINGFIVPAETFDNVKGKFPIGFTLWNTSIQSKIDTITTDIYDIKGNLSGTKKFYGNLPEVINKWIVKYQESKEKSIGTLFYRGNDFQNQNYIYINQGTTKAHDSELYINSTNLKTISIYLSIRHCIKATWLNDRDQFLAPNEKWKKDTEFQNDCLAFTLFHGQNKITSKEGTNHWIPFTEHEVDSREKFESNFMSQFIKGKIKPAEPTEDLFVVNEPKVHYEIPLQFSEEAKAVFEAGCALWIYYHKQPSINVNASLYDIKEHFQGRNEAGKMKNKSIDENYNQLINNLRTNLNLLAQKIELKVYEYEFLLQ
jgi:hypothetical protein